MTTVFHRLCVAAIVVFAMAAPLGQAQSDDFARSTSKRAAVEYLFPEQVTLPAGKATLVTLHFQIAQGLHINSHTPREKELIPTTLTFPAESGVQLAEATYPHGTDFALDVDPKTKLSVYTGELIIHARLVATAGDHLVEAKLRYQACDERACMPPKTISVPIDVIGK